MEHTYFTNITPTCGYCGVAIMESMYYVVDNKCYHNDCPKYPKVILTPEQDKHIRQIQDDFSTAVRLKYTEGVKEHGGNIWDLPNLIDEAMKEVIDLYVYLHTLRGQLHGGKTQK